MAATTSRLPKISWQLPWWRDWRELGQRVEGLVSCGQSVHAALNACQTSDTVDFVPQSALPEGMAYEAFIFETKSVPTRDNLHDFFNGLAWLRFPAIKTKLNALQYAAIQNNGVQPPQLSFRGPLRDALTLFDENAAFLCTDLHAPVIAALRVHDWHTAFQTHRGLLAEHPPVLFGHALLEKLVLPYKSIVAHVFPAQSAITLEAKDSAIASALSDSSLIPKPFAPLPVLGVPGWWAANENANFYADRTVFRPSRS
jgi:Protein of unknown function (DUF3025)